MKEALHILPDSVAGAYFLQAKISSNFLFMQDDLSWGPLLRIDDVDAWIAGRKWFVEWIRQDIDEQVLKGLPEFEHDLITLQNHRDSLLEAKQVVLWVGPSIAEQIFLAWVIVVLERLGVDLGKIYLAQICYQNGRYVPKIWLAFMATEKKWVAYRKITRSQIRVAKKAWEIVSSPDPTHLYQFSQSDFEVLPLMVSRILRRKLRYPDPVSGLSHIERTLMMLVEVYRLDVTRVIANFLVKSGSEEDPDHVGDKVLFKRLLNLASPRCASPLVEFTGDVCKMHSASVDITDIGKQVLCGKENHVQLNGIDEWVGGVHLLYPSGHLWYHDSGWIVAAARPKFGR